MAGKGEIGLRMWRISFALISATGILCLVWFLNTPSESSAVFLFGYSLPRILLAFVLLIPSMLFAALLAPRFDRVIRSIEEFLNKLVKKPLVFLNLWVGLLLLAIFWTLFFLPEKRAIF